MSITTRCGYVAIIGRPNVGKSTLLNRLLKQKISITSRKPQTTRHRILGINTQGDEQIVYVDTPGMHRHIKRALNRYMNKTADFALHDVDIIVFVVDGLVWTIEDEWILEKIKQIAGSHPVILVVNKVDKIKEKEQLLPHLQQLSEKMAFAEIMPLSAKTADNLEVLEQVIKNMLPENPHFFPKDQITDRSERFLAAELIREKVMRFTGKELPYAVTVEVEEFKYKKKVLHISAVIWVEREGQKVIIIGEDGKQLKQLGILARLDMEKLFEHKVYLQLWVKIKEGWSDNERALRSLGYSDDV